MIDVKINDKANRHHSGTEKEFVKRKILIPSSIQIKQFFQFTVFNLMNENKHEYKKKIIMTRWKKITVKDEKCQITHLTEI